MSLEKIVAFDIDDVLFPLRETIVEEFNRRFGTDLDMNKYDCFSFSGWLARDYPEAHQILMKNGGKFGFFKHISERNLLVDTPPYTGAAETVRKTRDRGYKIAIVTFRGTLEKPDMFYRDGPKETMEWLRKFSIPYDYIRFTSEKAKALSEIQRKPDRKIVLFVEDHPANIIPVVDLGFEVAIIEKLYNRAKLTNGVDDETDYGRGMYTQADWDRVLRKPEDPTEIALIHQPQSIWDIKLILDAQERR